MHRANFYMGSEKHLGRKPGWVCTKNGGVTPTAHDSKPPHINADLSHPTNPATKVGATTSSRGANPPTNHHDSALLAGARRWLPLISKTVSARERSAAHLLAQLDNPPSWWKWSWVHHVSRWLTPHPGHGQRWERTERATGNERRATQ